MQRRWAKATKRMAVSAWRDDVTARRNSVSAFCVTTFQRSVPTQSLPGTRFTRRRVQAPRPRTGKLDPGQGGGRPASGRNAPASTRSARVTVSMFEVPDRTENLPPGRRETVSVMLSAEPRLSISIFPPPRNVTLSRSFFDENGDVA